jgi:hypothetical protein
LDVLPFGPSPTVKMNKQINVVNFAGNLKPNYLLGADIFTVMYVRVYILFSLALQPSEGYGLLVQEVS